MAIVGLCRVASTERNGICRESRLLVKRVRVSVVREKLWECCEIKEDGSSTVEKGMKWECSDISQNSIGS